MALQFDVLGYTYDDSEPAFTLLKGGYRYYHRITGQQFDKASFDAWMTASGKSFGANELGVPSAAWQAGHNTIISRSNTVASGGGGGGGTGAPITATVTKAPTATADDTGTITVAGGPADKAYTVTVTLKDAASAGDDVQNVSIAKGDTAAQAATKIAAAESDPNATATAVGAVITYTPKSGSTLAKLSVSVA